MITFDTTTIVCIIVIILQIGVIIYFTRKSRKKAKLSKEKAINPADAYTELRRLALSVTPHQLKLAIPNSETFIYGIIMDWDMGDVIVTLAAYVTGACSMYLNTGGGFVKGGQNADVADMAVDLVVSAKEYLDHTLPTTTTDLPGKNCVRFYFLTNQRMYMAEEQMGRFDDNTSAWLSLFEKANEVIAGMRKNGTGELASQLN